MSSQMIIAQALGLVGTAIMCLSFQCKESRKLFLVQFAASLTFSVHFFLLGAFTGLFLNLAELLRSFLLINGNKKWASHWGTMVFVMLLMAGCGALTWDGGWLSLLPTAAMVVSTPFLWTRNGKVLRLATLLFISPCWLVYNTVVFSIAGILTEGFNIISIVISFLRFGMKGLDYKSNSERGL